MGLIGYYLAVENERDYSGNIINPNLYIKRCYSGNLKTNTDIMDISNTIGMYETSNNGPYNYIATKSTNINVPSDISLNKGDIFNYTDTEINKTFKIKLINDEKSGDIITRKLKYNKNVNNNFFKDPSFNDPMFYIKANNSNIDDISASMFYEYINYLNDNCKDLIYKDVYYRIEAIRFFEGDDLSSNDYTFNNQNKIIKKELLLDSLINVYENINLSEEINNNIPIGLFKFTSKLTKEENINNIWEYCYNNLKIELKKYLYDNINNNEIFRYFDISSTIIDM